MDAMIPMKILQKDDKLTLPTLLYYLLRCIPHTFQTNERLFFRTHYTNHLQACFAIICDPRLLCIVVYISPILQKRLFQII